MDFGPSNAVEHTMTVISVVIGSTRQGRFRRNPAQWILQRLRSATASIARLLDLRDFPMPFLDEPVPPAMPGRPPYENVVKKSGRPPSRSPTALSSLPLNTTMALQRCSRTPSTGFILSGIRKAAAFVSYGGAAGVHRPAASRDAIELQLAPIRSSVHIPAATLWTHFQGGDVSVGLAELDGSAGIMIEDLLWWTAALKAARVSRS